MFNKNDCVVYPGIGFYKVSDIVDIKGKSFIRFVSEKNPTIMIPVSEEGNPVIRKLCSLKELMVAFRILKAPIKQDLPKKLPSLERIISSKFKTGSIFEIAEMVKMIWCFKKYRRLSVNEMRFLELGIDHLIEETAAVEGCSKERAKEKIDSCLV